MTFVSATAASDYYQRRKKTQKQAWRAAGRCVCCGKPAVIKNNGTPMSRCQRCRESSARSSRAYHERHRPQVLAKWRERRQRYTAAGKCQCGRPFIPGLKTCVKCRAKNAKWAKIYAMLKRQRYRYAGLCLRCDRPTGMNRTTQQHYRYCLWHRLEQATYAKARRAR